MHAHAGEYVLPSGTALPFGAMIAKLKRDRLMGDLMEGGEEGRAKWVKLLEDPFALEQELGSLAAVRHAWSWQPPARQRMRLGAVTAVPIV